MSGVGVGVGEGVGEGGGVCVGDGAVVGEGDCVVCGVPVCVGLFEGLGACVGFDTRLVFEPWWELAKRDAAVTPATPAETSDKARTIIKVFFELLLMVMQISPLYYYLRLNKRKCENPYKNLLNHNSILQIHKQL